MSFGAEVVLKLVCKLFFCLTWFRGGWGCLSWGLFCRNLSFEARSCKLNPEPETLRCVFRDDGSSLEILFGGRGAVCRVAGTERCGFEVQVCD